MAAKLVDTLVAELRPRRLRGHATATRCWRLIKRKAKGEEIDLAAQEEPEHGDDLVAALEASVPGALMARPLWSGALSFGLVNVPVQLVSAARDLDFHFHQLHAKDKRRIEQRRFCKKEDVEVGWEEIAHSYDLDGKQVVLSDEELGSVEPRKTRTIEIEAFVEPPRSTRSTSTTPTSSSPPARPRHAPRLPPAGRGHGPKRSWRSGAS